MKSLLSLTALFLIVGFMPSAAFAYGGPGIPIGFGAAPKKTGQVLGESTDAPSTCTPLLTTYMRIGAENDPQEVTDLQNFLNKEMNAGLPVTGVFGPLTDAAVKAFQAKYKSEVLTPWVAHGFTDEPTGYVFKLTQWKINSIHCAPMVIPKPSLP